MRILGSRDLNFVVAVNNSLAIDFVDDKGTSQAMVRPAKLEAGLFRREHFKGNADVMKGSVDQFARLRRPVDIDLPRVRGEIKVEVIVRHYVDEAEIMVRVINALIEGLLFQRFLTPELMPDEVFHAAFAALATRPPNDLHEPAAP